MTNTTRLPHPAVRRRDMIAAAEHSYACAFGDLDTLERAETEDMRGKIMDRFAGLFEAENGGPSVLETADLWILREGDGTIVTVYRSPAIQSWAEKVAREIAKGKWDSANDSGDAPGWEHAPEWLIATRPEEFPALLSAVRDACGDTVADEVIS